MKFEWNEQKNQLNKNKHGISFHLKKLKRYLMILFSFPSWIVDLIMVRKDGLRLVQLKKDIF